MITFSELLNAQVRKRYRGTTKNVTEYLTQNGCEITYRSFQRYFKGERVPTYQIAKKILDAMNIQFSETDLMDMLNYSKVILSENNLLRKNNEADVKRLMVSSYGVTDDMQNKERIEKISFSPKDIDIDAPDDMKESILNSRLVDLYGEYDIRKYIMDLVQLDLEKEILEGKEDK